MQRSRAYLLYRKALKSGALVKPDACELCGRRPGCDKFGRSKIRGHHWHGYDEVHALDVQWLCITCHNREHSMPAWLAKSTHEQRVAISREAAVKHKARCTPEEYSESKRRGATATNATRVRRKRYCAVCGEITGSSRLTCGDECRRVQRSAFSRISGRRTAATIRAKSFEELSAAARKSAATRQARYTPEEISARIHDGKCRARAEKRAS